MAELGRVSSRTPEDDDGFSLGRMFSGSLSQPYTCGEDAINSGEYLVEAAAVRVASSSSNWLSRFGTVTELYGIQSSSLTLSLTQSRHSSHDFSFNTSPLLLQVRMANFTLMFSDLKEGRRSTTVEIRLRFWESRSLQISRFCIKNYVTGFKDLEPVIWICLLFGEPRLARTTTTAADGFAIFGGIFFQRGAVEGVSIQPGTRLMILDHFDAAPPQPTDATVLVGSSTQKDPPTENVREGKKPRFA
ncbi:hypothetical protein Bca4012_063592 [Brassica carinata]